LQDPLSLGAESAARCVLEHYVGREARVGA
jgi:hypothetical protein